jgi:hypothetical protein
VKVVARLVIWVVLLGGADLLLAALFPGLDTWIGFGIALAVVTAIITGYDVAREKRDDAADSQGRS